MINLHGSSTFTKIVIYNHMHVLQQFFLPRDAMRKRGILFLSAGVCPSVCLQGRIQTVFHSTVFQKTVRIFREFLCSSFTLRKVKKIRNLAIYVYLTSCRRAAATICPRLSPPPWAPKRLAPLSRRQRSSSFPRPTRSHAHRCSRLTRQHGGEQSGLVTLTF